MTLLIRVTYVRGTLNMLEKYHQGHLTYERISNWQKHWRATVKNETNYWGRGSGTTVSIYKSKNDYDNDKPFYLQTERNISQKMVNTLESGAGGGNSGPANTGNDAAKEQAPALIKVIVGLNPIISVPNALKILITGVDIYGVEVATKTDKVLATFGIIGGLGRFTQIATIANTSDKALKDANIIGEINTGVQVANDAGALDKIK